MPDCASAGKLVASVPVCAISAVCACVKAVALSVALAGSFRLAATAAMPSMRPDITSNGECMPARMRFSPNSVPRVSICWKRSGTRYAIATASRMASAEWPLMKPPSVPGVVLSAGTSAGTTTTLLLQRYGRAYL